jgi:3-isopropylmalate/(R)-2-methylmalate dehydratase small subunit
MEPTRRVVGRVAPLDRSNVDTDQIIPAAWLKRVERSGFGQGLFEAWRADPAFVLNRPEHQGATVLVTGPNFGTGSSREHAVWALMDWGFKAVVSPSFADIFRNNCTKAGLVPAQLPGAACRALIEAATADPSLEVVVDVEALSVSAPAIGLKERFALSAFDRQRLLEGLDDIGLTLRHEQAIAAYERRRPAFLPRLPRT